MTFCIIFEERIGMHLRIFLHPNLLQADKKTIYIHLFGGKETLWKLQISDMYSLAGHLLNPFVTSGTP